jgi:murein DD-endopeptidase MepM/ murein hydrolase activator NlpD
MTSFSFAADILHVIEKGDTLYSVSRKYGVSVDEICSANKITNPAKVKLGQSIRIPQKSSSVEKKLSYTDYLVQPGDTLFSIARNYNSSVAAIRKANNMSESATLKSGQRIKIPAGSSSVKISATDFASVKSEKVIPQSPMTDPRSYQTKNIDSSTIWPVKANELCYVEGKTNSVVLNGNRGESVTAVRSGTVIFSGLYRGFGKVVFIQPKSSDYVYVYSGLDSIAVQKGDSVDYGAVIGRLGIDTRTQKPQLNFMVFKNGTAIDPAVAPRG